MNMFGWLSFVTEKTFNYLFFLWHLQQMIKWQKQFLWMQILPLLLSTKSPGLSCSKLTTSLVNDSLKFTSSDKQICFCPKNVSSFCSAKATHIYSEKISEYCVLNPLKKLTKWPLTSLLS